MAGPSSKEFDLSVCVCVYTALNLANIRVCGQFWQAGGIRGFGDADGLAGRMRTGPRAPPSGLAWSPRPGEKVEKNTVNTLTFTLSQSISTCRTSHTYSHKHWTRCGHIHLHPHILKTNLPALQRINLRLRRRRPPQTCYFSRCLSASHLSDRLLSESQKCRSGQLA